MGCNGQSFHFAAYPMRLKRRRLSNFEACSVALFTSLALGGAALAVRAQTPSTHSISAAPSAYRSTARGAPANSAQAGQATTRAAIPPNHWPPERPAQTFKRGDGNGGEQLSHQEASVWPGPSRRFDRIDTTRSTSYSAPSPRSDLSHHVDHIDTGKDGSISSAQFDESLK